jgi:hypothetical protein
MILAKRSCSRATHSTARAQAIGKLTQSDRDRDRNYLCGHTRGTCARLIGATSSQPLVAVVSRSLLALRLRLYPYDHTSRFGHHEALVG